MDAAPLRVLTIVGNAIVGGMEAVVEQLAERLPQAGCELALVAPFESPFTERVRPRFASLHIAPMSDEAVRWHTIQRVAGLVRSLRSDVIHAHLWTAHPVAALAGRITGTPVLASVHGMHLSLLDLEAHRLGGTRLAVVSDAAYAHAVAIGVAPAHLTRIYNGVDTERFAPRAEPRDDACVTIGYVGRLSPEKNPALFVRAAARVHAAAPQARFAVVGDGPLRADLEALARQSGVAGVLRFDGERLDMPRVYRELDVLALTSHHEGTPLALLEAMASGVPVVATSVGGVPELVCVGGCGLLVPPADEQALAAALGSLVHDPALRRRLARGARERAVRHFPIARTVAEYAALLRRVASEAPGSPRAMSALHTLRAG